MGEQKNRRGVRQRRAARVHARLARGRPRSRTDDPRGPDRVRHPPHRRGAGDVPGRFDAWHPAHRARRKCSSGSRGANFTPELARFNLEANLSPKVLETTCLSEMENELVGMVRQAGRAAAAESGARVMLVGILPTLHQRDLSLDNMVPNPRYHTLNRVMSDLRGGLFETHIKGLDELSVSHDNVMMEACNTSFQVHFQVGADEFAGALQPGASRDGAGPRGGRQLARPPRPPSLARDARRAVPAIARRPFEAPSDARPAPTRHVRGSLGRSLGDGDLPRGHRALPRAACDRPRRVVDSTSWTAVRCPSSRRCACTTARSTAGTVPCYGVKDGKAHLRIENRVLPAGPTIDRRDRQRRVLLRSDGGARPQLRRHPRGHGASTTRPATSSLARATV